MNWTDEPATWKQLRFLRRCGYEPNGRLSKAEAATLIARYGGPLERAPVENEPQLTLHAYDFRVAVEKAKAEAAKAGANVGARAALDQALTERQEFWLDTCRGAAHLKSGCSDVLQLYRMHGCLFSEPTHRQVQDILDALDAAMPLWEQDHPELFYQALGLNFPELMKRGGLKL